MFKKLGFANPWVTLGGFFILVFGVLVINNSLQKSSLQISSRAQTCTIDANCPSGQMCSAGTCVSRTCNIDADCPSGQMCSGGVCIGACPSGQTRCSGLCVDLNGNENCGGCGNVCGGDLVCNGGMCAGPACSKPGTPGIMSAIRKSVNATYDSVDLAWIAASGATHHQIFQSTDGGVTWSWIYEVGTTSFTIPNLNKTSTYLYKVRGVILCLVNNTPVIGNFSSVSQPVPPLIKTINLSLLVSQGMFSFDVKNTGVILSDLPTSVPTTDANGNVNVVTLQWTGGSCAGCWKTQTTSLGSIIKIGSFNTKYTLVAPTGWTVDANNAFVITTNPCPTMSAPTISSPINNSTVPSDFSSVLWYQPTGAVKYWVMVFDPATGTVVYDSGKLQLAVQPPTVQNRYNFPAGSLNLTPGKQYSLEVYVENACGSVHGASVNITQAVAPPTNTPTPGAAEKKACSTDAECGCGIDINSTVTTQCVFQNKKFLSLKFQCTTPDFCAGISGTCKPQCVNQQCERVCPGLTPTSTPTPIPLTLSLKINQGKFNLEINPQAVQADLPLSTPLADVAGNISVLTLQWTQSSTCNNCWVSQATDIGSTVIIGSFNTKYKLTAPTGWSVNANNAFVINTYPTNTPTPTVTTTPVSCTTVSTTWMNKAIQPPQGTFTAEFDAKPNAANIDGVFGLSSVQSTAFTQLATLVRFNTTGTIDARDGSSYKALTTVSYAAGTVYHFKMTVNLQTKKYSLTVKPTGGTDTVIATDFAFRTEQANISSIAYWAGHAAVAAGFEVCSFTIISATITPNPTVCTMKKEGDSDCVANGVGKQITLADFEIWRTEYYNGCDNLHLTADKCFADEDKDGSLMDANFDYPGSSTGYTDEAVKIPDFEIWRQAYYKYGK